MRTVLHQGVTYDLSDDQAEVKYIATDTTGLVYGYRVPPLYIPEEGCWEATDCYMKFLGDSLPAIPPITVLE